MPLKACHEAPVDLLEDPETPTTWGRVRTAHEMKKGAVDDSY